MSKPSRERSNGTPVNAERARKSMARLMSIYAGISDKAADSTVSRCPYKDARARCNARFPCRNQFFKVPGEKAICTGSDDLDYRSAWQV